MFLGQLLVFGFFPGVFMRCLLLFYPKGHERRDELLGQLYDLKPHQQPLFVARHAEIAIFEGLPARWHQRKRTLPSPQELMAEKDPVLILNDVHVHQFKPSELTDDDLLRGASEDPELFGVFYDRHFDRVLNYFTRRTSSPQRAADLTAETFVSVLTGCPRFNTSQGSALSWLFGIARHVLIAQLRSEEAIERMNRRLSHGEMPIELDPFVGVDSQVDSEALLDEFLCNAPRGKTNGIRDLMRHHRRPVTAAILRYAYDLRIDDIARHLGCENWEARRLTQTGLRLLKKHLTPPCP